MALQSKSSEPPLKRVKNVIIRNLLSAPDDDEWPRLPERETELLKAELKKNLGFLQVPEVKRPWREMNKLSKDKRKAFMKKFEEDLAPDILRQREVARQMRSWLFLGINAVSRAIESDAVSCCLLAEDVSPSSLVKHVVQLSTHAKIPVFLVGGFKKYCKEVMGFPCIALGFAKLCSPNVETNVFGEVCTLIEKFQQDFEKNKRNSAKSTNGSDVDSEDAAPAGKQHITTQTTTTVLTADAQESCDFLSSASSFHLLRRSKYERAFVPDAALEVPDSVEPTTEKASTKTSFGGKNRMKYKLPTVLRVRNNPFKLKRKKKKKKAP